MITENVGMCTTVMWPLTLQSCHSPTPCWWVLWFQRLWRWQSCCTSWPSTCYKNNDVPNYQKLLRPLKKKLFSCLPMAFGMGLLNFVVPAKCLIRDRNQVPLIHLFIWTCSFSNMIPPLDWMEQISLCLFMAIMSRPSITRSSRSQGSTSR